MDRLALLAGEFQRIALSATVRPLGVVADFVGGYIARRSDGDYVYEKRPVAIVQSAAKKSYDAPNSAPMKAKPLLLSVTVTPPTTASVEKALMIGKAAPAPIRVPIMAKDMR